MRTFSQDDRRPLDVIRLREMQVSCIIGIYPEEAHRAQALTLNLSLFLDTKAAARSGHLALSVDYAELAQDIRFILQRARFGLLETAAEALTQCVLRSQSLVEAVDIELSKPEALPGLALPTLHVHRNRKDQKGEDDNDETVVFDGAGLRLLRLTLAPEAEFAWKDSELSLIALRASKAGLVKDGMPLGAGAELCGTLIEACSLRNESFEALTIWIVARQRSQELKTLATLKGLGNLTTH